MRVRKKISQREALRLRKQVNGLLKEQAAARSQYRDEYPGGVNIATIDLGTGFPNTLAKLGTATQFSDVFIAKFNGVTNKLLIFAIPKSR